MKNIIGLPPELACLKSPTGVVWCVNENLWRDEISAVYAGVTFREEIPTIVIERYYKNMGGGFTTEWVFEDEKVRDKVLHQLEQDLIAFYPK